MVSKNRANCEHKPQYSQTEAKQRAVAAMKVRNRKLRAYKCSVCFSYHLTSQKMDKLKGNPNDIDIC